ncbi:hypothetical protein ACFSHP_24860 [Novosphingobium panipatense]
MAIFLRLLIVALMLGASCWARGNGCAAIPSTIPGRPDPEYAGWLDDRSQGGCSA